MPQFYRVLKADPLDGEFTPNKPGAKPLKSFWCQVEDVNEPVMITKQVPNTPSLTEGHYGVLEPKRSSKGTQYFKFTSMQMPEGTSKPKYASSETSEASTTTSQTHTSVDETVIPTWFNPFAIMIRELWDDMRARNSESLLANPAPHSEETATEEAPVDAEMLKEIFGEDLPDPVEIPEDK